MREVETSEARKRAQSTWRTRSPRRLCYQSKERKSHGDKYLDRWSKSYGYR